MGTASVEDHCARPLWTNFVWQSWSWATSWHEPGQDSDFQKFGLSRNKLEAFWRLRRDILRHLGGILVECAAIVEDPDHFGSILDRLGVFWRRLGGTVRRFGCVLEASWGVLEGLGGAM